jgi:hypothetical protein
VSVRAPSDLGYSDDGFILPKLNIHDHVVAAGNEIARLQGNLFTVEARGLSEQRAARHASLDERVRVTAEIVNREPSEPWLVWCDLNAEGEALTKAIPGAVEITGSDTPEFKEETMAKFIAGEIRILVSKPSIAGWGVNLQHCARVAYVGLSHSFEAWYQSVRRVYRFGQKREVHCYVVTSDAEGAVVANLHRKQQDAESMARGMVAEMSEFTKDNIRATARDATEYNPQRRMTIPEWIGRDATP